MNYLDYAIFFITFFPALGPGWADRVPLLDAAQKIFALKKISPLNFNFSVWQSIFLISQIGLLIGLGIRHYAAMPRFMAILIGGGFVWAVLLAKLLILYWWLRRCQYRSGIIRLFNVLVASKLLPIMAVSGVMIAAPGDPSMLKLFATPLFIIFLFPAEHCIKSFQILDWLASLALSWRCWH